MNEEIKKLKKEFEKIRNIPLSKSLRKGSTGIGYTFETLLGKKEDQSYFPDFNGIELKTKLGYTKAPLTLFNLTPLKDNELSIPFILNNYGYPINNNKEYKKFSANVYNKRNEVAANKYLFKTKIDYKNNKLQLIISDRSFNIINKDIYWNLNELEKRLTTKLNYLAYIIGYPYKIKDEIYYKYTNLYIYKLKDFKTFLKLIEQDIVHITFNIDVFDKEYRHGQIHDHGTAFKIDTDKITELFTKIS